MRITNWVSWSARRDISIIDRATRRGITIADYVADLISLNIDILVLEFDIKLLDRAASEFKTKIETSTSNIGTNNSNIGCINNCITGLSGRVTVLEGRPDYTSDIISSKDSIISLESQGDSITIPD
jgi:hypothetical protein